MLVASFEMLKKKKSFKLQGRFFVCRLTLYLNTNEHSKLWTSFRIVIRKDINSIREENLKHTEISIAINNLIYQSKIAIVVRNCADYENVKSM